MSLERIGIEACSLTAWPRGLTTGEQSAALLIGGLKASYSAALPALMAEIFPTRTRSTGMNLSYNIGVTVFGGFAPFWNESLIALTHTTLAPSFYLMFVACLSIVSLILVRQKLGLR